MKLIAIAIGGVTVTGCITGDHVSYATGTGEKRDGCPPNEQPVFSPNGGLECDEIPSWPPRNEGSRAVDADCTLLDGSYQIRWHSDIVSDLAPAFSATNVLTIGGDSMYLDLVLDLYPHNPNWHYPFSLDWVNAARAHVWQPGDSNTWEFYVRRDCESGEVRGSYTVNLPYYNRGNPQVVTWTLTGTP